MTHLSVLVGTTKGAFVLDGGAGRSGWQVSGPHCDLWPINHVIGDPETGTLWAGGGGEWHGAGVWRSADGGASWTLAKLSSGQVDDWAAKDPDFAAMIGWAPDPAALRQGHRAGLVACPCPGHALRRHQAGDASGQPRRRRELGRSDGSFRTPLAPRMDPGWRRPRAAFDRAAGRRPAKAVGRHLGRRDLCHRGWRRDMGTAQPPVECRCRPAQPPRPPGRAEGWRDRALRAQPRACTGRGGRLGRPALPAEPPRGVPVARWRAGVGRHHRRPALDLRLSDPCPPARPGHGLDAAA